jgi:hypothetical protein
MYLFVSLFVCVYEFVYLFELYLCLFTFLFVFLPLCVNFSCKPVSSPLRVTNIVNISIRCWWKSSCGSSKQNINQSASERQARGNA